MRVARPDAIPDAPDRLRTWLDEGHHGSMDWMAAAPERRADPRALWPAVRSIVVLGVNYAPPFDPLATLDRRDRASRAGRRLTGDRARWLWTERERERGEGRE